jgi:hypothetical protein
VGDQLAQLGILRLVGQRGERAFERQPAADEARELARPHGQAGGREHPPAETQGAARFPDRGRDLRHVERHERLRAQLGSRCARVVRLQQTGGRLAGGVERFELVGGHPRRPSLLPRHAHHLFL